MDDFFIGFDESWIRWLDPCGQIVVKNILFKFGIVLIRLLFVSKDAALYSIFTRTRRILLRYDAWYLDGGESTNRCMFKKLVISYFSRRSISYIACPRLYSIPASFAITINAFFIAFVHYTWAFRRHRDSCYWLLGNRKPWYDIIK